MPKFKVGDRVRVPGSLLGQVEVLQVGTCSDADHDDEDCPFMARGENEVETFKFAYQASFLPGGGEGWAHSSDYEKV